MKNRNRLVFVLGALFFLLLGNARAQRLRPEQFVTINDCIFADGSIGLDGPCRRNGNPDCAGEPSGEERFVHYTTYFPAFRSAGFNTWRHGNCGLKVGRDDAYIIPLFQYLKSQGWTVWAVMNDPGDVEIHSLSLAREKAERLIRTYGTLVDVWELAGESRPEAGWVASLAASTRLLAPRALITTSWNDSVYAPYIDFNSPHAYLELQGWNAYTTFKQWTEAERAKMPQLPLAWGESGGSPWNWRRDNPTIVHEVFKACRDAGVGCGVWSTTNAKDYFQPGSANFYLGPAERAMISQALATGGGGGGGTVPTAHHPDTGGIFRPSDGTFYLRNSNTGGYADIAIAYGLPGDLPVTGDWDGNGTDTIGIYRGGVFLLRNSNTAGDAEIRFAFGSPGDQPLAGDWNGDGIDTVGVFRHGLFLLRNANSAGPADHSFLLGTVGDVGIAGDWNGTGADTGGVYRPSNGSLLLRFSNTTGSPDVVIPYGTPGDFPVTGDWDGNGTDTIGVYRHGGFLLRNSNTAGYAEIMFSFGALGDWPLAGDWDGR